jgi:His/Glu/Gln/Arg/opine family amino acid ABC transporter permease subunit
LTFVDHALKILPSLLEGMALTLVLTFTSALGGTALGLIAAIARISKNRALTSIATAYVTLFRGTPLLLQILFVYGALPQVGLVLSGFNSAAIALSLNAGAYIAEIIRAAIQSIDKGQMEAARSLGMSYGLAMRRIILPQTFRRLLPPMVNELAALAKDTSLASVVGVIELMKASSHVVARTLLVGSTYVWTALGYLIMTVALTSLAIRLEKKLEARE